MEILYFNEQLFTKDNDLFVWILVIIAALIFIAIAIFNWKNEIVRYVNIFGAVAILAVPITFMIIEEKVLYLTCEYAVIEHHNTVPKGYKTYDEKGDILFIKKQLSKPEYEASGCNLEEEIGNGLLE